MGDGGGLEDLEAIRAIERGDLAVGELGEELGLLVVLEVDVGSGQVDLDSAESSGSADLYR